MKNTKKYSYSLFGNFKNFTKLRNLSSEIRGVVAAELDEGSNVLTLSIDEQASEYDVFCALNNIAESLSVEVDYADDGGKDAPVVEEAEAESEADAVTEEEQPPVPAAPVFDKKKSLPDEQKPWKTRYLSNLVEMGLSLVLILVASIFDISGNFGMIMYLLAFAVVGYEIIWDAVTAVLKKDYFNYNIPVVIATVVSLFVTSYREAAVVALIFEAVIVAGRIAKDFTSSRLNGRLYYNYNVIKQGEGEDEVQLFAHEVEVGAALDFKEGDVIPFDCRIECGSAELDSFNITGSRVRKNKTVGQVICGGERIVSGSVKVVVKSTVDQSVAGRLYSRLTNDDRASQVKQKRTSAYALLACLAAGVLVCFIAPLFELSSVSYGVGLAKWAYVAIMIVAVSNSFASTIASELTVISGLNLALSMNSFVLSASGLEEISAADKVVFGDAGVLSEGEARIVKTSAMPAYKGKINKIISGLCVDAEELLVKAVEGSYEGKSVIVGNLDELEARGISVKNSSLGGIVRYVAVDGVQAGAISIAGGLKSNTVGVVRELRDAGVRSVVVSSDTEAFAEIERYVEVVPEITGADLSGSVWVGKDMPENAIANIAFADVTEEIDGSCSVVVSSDDVKPVAKLIKLAKRQVKKSKQNAVLSVILKVVALALGVALALLTSVPSFWIVVAISCVADLICILNAYFNGADVY